MKSLTLTLILLVGSLAHAQSTRPSVFSSLNGTWQEMGYRCPGAAVTHPRDDSAFSKFFSISGNTYEHRVVAHDRGPCPIIKSSGTLEGREVGGLVLVKLTPQNDVACTLSPKSSLVDDYMLENSPYPLFTMGLEITQGEVKLIVGGDRHYISGDCPQVAVERVFKFVPPQY